MHGRPPTFTNLTCGMADGGEESSCRLLPHELWTAIGPKAANHSFSGIVFDAVSSELHDVIIDKVHVAGMLGSVTVYASVSGWAGGEETRQLRRCGWGNTNDVLDKSEWAEVGRAMLHPSWEKLTAIALHSPLVLAPGAPRGLYIHSAEPGDGGLIYTSYPKGCFAQSDDHLRLFVTPPPPLPHVLTFSTCVILSSQVKNPWVF